MKADRYQNPGHWFLGTHADNMADMVAKGRSNKERGARNGRAKLTEDQVSLIRTQYRAGGVTQKALAQQFGVSRANISYICSGTNWSDE